MWLQTKFEFLWFFTKQFSAEHFIDACGQKKITISLTDLSKLFYGNYCSLLVGGLTFSIEHSNKRLVFFQLLHKNFASFTQLFTGEMKWKKKVYETYKIFFF